MGPRGVSQALLGNTSLTTLSITHNQVHFRAILERGVESSLQVGGVPPPLRLPRDLHKNRSREIAPPWDPTENAEVCGRTRGSRAPRQHLSHHPLHYSQPDPLSSRTCNTSKGVHRLRVGTHGERRWLFEEPTQSRTSPKILQYTKKRTSA